jgi:hypothetical protein
MFCFGAQAEEKNSKEALRLQVVHEMLFLNFLCLEQRSEPVAATLHTGSATVDINLRSKFIRYRYSRFTYQRQNPSPISWARM